MMVDDFAANTSTRGRLSVGGQTTGLIETAGDRDWFAISLASGQSYDFHLDSTGLGDPFLALYSGAGNLLASNDDGGGNFNSRITYTPATSATYYLAAMAYAQETGSYRVTASQLDDFAGDASTAGWIALGGQVNGRIDSAGDQDWLALTLATGQSVQVRLASTGLADPYLTLYSSNGSALLTDDDGGGGLDALLSFDVTAGGTFYLGVRDYATGTGGYSVAVTPSVVDDFANDSSTSGRLQVNSSTTGRIGSAGDEDWFSISLSAGQSCAFQLNGEGLADPYLTLYAANGSEIARNDDGGGGLNSRIDFTATSAGVYYLGARDYGTGTGNFRLSATLTASDDFADTTLTAGRVTVGSSTSGRIEAVGDRDALAVTLVAGQKYEFRLDSNGLTDPYLSLHDGNGTELLADDDSGGGRNALLTYTAPVSGTYFLLAQDYAGGAGAYTVGATAVQASAAAGSFAIDVVFSGDTQYATYFTVAAQRWGQVITGDLPDVVDAQYGRIDDLLIEASVQAIDGVGRILGQAGFTGQRSTANGSLPYRGLMQFDSADLAAMEANGTLASVILHEMGHVLGLSDSMFRLRGLVSGSDFVGSHAVAEYRLVANNALLSAVPLETGGGNGTRGSHWSETLFRTELMTGYAESAPPMPLSVLTVGALQDLGYAVNYATADIFSL